MTYNGFYFRLFSRPMKRVLAEKYGPRSTRDIPHEEEQSRSIAGWSRQADDLRQRQSLWPTTRCSRLPSSRRMWPATKRLPPETVQEMMRRALYSRQVVFRPRRPEHGKGQGGKQKEHHPVRQMVHAGARAAVPHLLQGGFRRPAPRGRLLLPHHPLPHLRLRPKAGRRGADAALLRAGQRDDRPPARRSSPQPDACFRRGLLRLLHHRQQRINSKPTVKPVGFLCLKSSICLKGCLPRTFKMQSIATFPWYTRWFYHR